MRKYLALFISIIAYLAIAATGAQAQTPPDITAAPAPSVQTITARSPIDGKLHTLHKKLLRTHGRQAEGRRADAATSDASAADALLSDSDRGAYQSTDQSYGFYGYTTVSAFLYGWYDSRGTLYAVFGVGQAFITTGTGSGYLDVYVDRNGVEAGYGTGNFYRYYQSGFLVEQHAFVDSSLVWVSKGVCYNTYAEAISYYQYPYQPYNGPKYNYDFSFTFCNF